MFAHHDSARSRTIVVFVACLAAVFSISPLSGQQQHAQPAAPRPLAPDTVLRGDAAQVGATVRALFAAVERGDLAALDSLYAGDSTTIVEGAGISRGWADYRDHHLGPELKEMTNVRYRPFEIEARTAGNVAWATFRYALSANMGTRAIDLVGRGTAILERRGNRWLLRHTHTSGRTRRPADPPMPE